ncbi:hypothetical protein L593_02410 [Salinarchaeum sp. Harcht-Bsk1]|uniref:1,2-phenylacetyl-CoA epoxidase subunit PaaD n=1 Tax=Salinarchaeum sp. Harcht-Bsk1 TaxID=1333523 RepID=UPI0003424081|nr:1,2-phenylacetyl-CoA epoxidase subunit PaaD [Salinarchaeum sp. Harcht-Bsk1]AGN00433.1 hypothetical protein L593_02410 [Salinarchaeum sp. Harcht-Bsk1]
MHSDTERGDDDPGFDRPEADADATACHHTDYDTAGDRARPDAADGERVHRESVDGEVPATGHGADGLERRVWDALYGVEDPEMPISIVDLGLVYDLEVDEEAGTAAARMTLTYTGCPARDMLLDDVERAVASVDGIEDATVELVWSPPWEVELVTEQGKDALREFGLSI